MKTLLTMLVLCLALAAIAVPAPAAPTLTGLVHEYSADADDGADNQWNDAIVGGQDPYWNLAQAGPIVRTAVTGSLSNFAYAFAFDGSGEARGATAAGDLKSGGWSQVSATTPTTFEVWLRADVSSLANDAYMGILDFGGSGNGAGIYFYRDASGDVRIQARPSTSDLLSSAVLGSADFADYLHVVMSIDTSANSYSLFVNLAETSATLATKDFGNNPVALGAKAGQAGGISSDPAMAGLVGDIALVRIYDGNALDATEVEANYNDAIPEPATMSLLAVGAAALLRRRTR